MKRTLVLSALVTAALVLSACRTSTSTSVTATPTTAAASATATSKPADTPVPKETAKPTASPTAVLKETPRPTAAATPTTASTDDPLAFLQKVSTTNKGDYRVVYDIKGQDQTGKAQTYHIAYYKKGEQTRVDTTTTDGSKTQTTRQYMKGDQLVSCNETAPNKWACTTMSGELAKLTASMMTLLIEAPQEILQEAISQGEKPQQQPSRKIAGQDAKVYLFKATPPETGEVEFAFTNDGILLLMDARNTGSQDGRMEATEFSRQVADSDLVPPA